MVEFQSKSKGWRSRRVDGINSNLKADKTHEDSLFQFESKGSQSSQNLMSQFQSGQEGILPSLCWEGQAFT